MKNLTYQDAITALEQFKQRTLLSLSERIVLNQAINDLCIIEHNHAVRMVIEQGEQDERQYDC